MGVVSRSNLNTLADRMEDLWSYFMDVDDDYVPTGQSTECLRFILPNVRLTYALMTEFAKVIESDTITELVGVLEVEEVTANNVVLYFPGFTIEET